MLRFFSSFPFACVLLIARHMCFSLFVLLPTVLETFRELFTNSVEY